MSCSLIHQNNTDSFASIVSQCVIDRLLELDNLTFPVAAIGRQYHFAASVLNSVCNDSAEKPPKTTEWVATRDMPTWRPRFLAHGHVIATLLYALRLKYMRKLHTLGEVGDSCGSNIAFRFPSDRIFLLVRFWVSIQTALGGVSSPPTTHAAVALLTNLVCVATLYAIRYP